MEDFEDFIESFEALDFRDVMEAEEELADPTPEDEEDVSLERSREESLEEMEEDFFEEDDDDSLESLTSKSE